ncbi:SET domain-containing protein [Pseudomonas sp. GNP014]
MTELITNLLELLLGGFINHSDKPNCGRSQIRIRPGFDKWNIIVVEKIPAGNELTLKYIMYDPAKSSKVNGMAYLGGP